MPISDIELRDRLSELIQSAFDKEADFLQHFALDGAMFDSDLDGFYMAGERCFVRYQMDGFMHYTTICTADFLDWVELVSS